MAQTDKKPSQARLGTNRLTLTGESARNARGAINRLFSYALPYTGRLIVVAVLVVIGTFANLAGPILLGTAIDQFISSGDLPGLIQISLTMVGVFLLGGLAAVIYGIIMVGVGQRLIRDLRAGLFTHLQYLSMAYHDHHKVFLQIGRGRLQARGCHNSSRCRHCRSRHDH